MVAKLNLLLLLQTNVSNMVVSLLYSAYYLGLTCQHNQCVLQKIYRIILMCSHSSWLLKSLKLAHHIAFRKNDRWIFENEGCYAKLRGNAECNKYSTFWLTHCSIIPCSTRISVIEGFYYSMNQYLILFRLFRLQCLE